MKFARIIFGIAGAWGLAVLMPFHGLVDITGRHYTAPVEYPQFFWGFVAVALTWQVAFLLIASNPFGGCGAHRPRFRARRSLRRGVPPHPSSGGRESIAQRERKKGSHAAARGPRPPASR